uniref:BESS domain-containing protein n=1 Tax=Clastoptera arizonana TaxID=38151 RepID=A0A1B6E1F7_9HEMI
MPSGSVSKKKKWHLADAMEFLLPWTGPSRKTSGISDKSLDPDTASPSNQEITITYDYYSDLHDEEEANYEANGEVGNYNLKKKQRKTPVELVANPMAEYLKTIKLNHNTNKHKLEELKKENEFLSFFKSLIPDAGKLSARRKREFKSSVMTKLHQLLEEQENEQASYNIDIFSCV